MNIEAILREHQDIVYTLCRQIVGNDHDAEDAAQETLVKVARASLPAEPRAWICKIAIHTAIDARRRRRTRAAHEMKKPPPDTTQAVPAVAEALSFLDDGERALILDHYFEKVTIAELARRDQCSVGTIWSRIDRAREALRAALVSMGFSAVLLDGALAQATVLRAPAGLVKSSLAAAAMGGLVMGKTVSWSVAVLILLATFGGGFLGGALTASKRLAGAHPAEAGTSGRAAPAERTQLEEARRENEALRRELAVRFPGESSAPAAPSALTTRLARWKAWEAGAHARTAQMEAAGRSPVERTEFYRSLWQEQVEELKGLRELILKEPEVFAAFAHDPANGRGLHFLFAALDPHAGGEGAGESSHYESMAALPGPLSELVQRFLEGGTDEQRYAALRLMPSIDDLGEDYRDRFIALLSHGNGAIQEQALGCLARSDLPASLLPQLQAMAVSSTHPTLVNGAISAIARIGDPAAFDFLLARVEANDAARKAVGAKLVALGVDAPAGAVSRFMGALSADLSRNPGRFAEVVQTALWLPVNQAIPVLESAAASSDAKVRRAGLALLEAVHKGETRPHMLMMLLHQKQQEP